MRVMSYTALDGGRDGRSDKRWRTTVGMIVEAALAQATLAVAGFGNPVSLARAATASDHLPVRVDLDPDALGDPA